METSMNYNRMTTIFFISGIIVIASLYTALPLTSVFAKDFGISNAVASLNGVIFSIAYSLSCLFYGIISEKFGCIRTILFGLTGLIIMCLLIGFIRSFMLLIILRAVQGICAAAFSPISIAYVTEMYSPVRHMTVISFISTSFMLSGTIGQDLGEIVVHYSNWHMAYFVLTLFYILTVILIYKFVPESPVKNPQLKLVGSFKNFKDLKDNEIVILCYFTPLSLLTMFISMYIIFSHYITSDIVGGSKATAINVKLFSIIGMLLSLLAERISGHTGVRQVIVGALVVSVVLLILMVFTANINPLIIWSMLFVRGTAFAIPSTISKVDMVVNRNQGFFLSVNTLILFLGTAIAPLLITLIQPLSNFILQFIMITVIGIIALIVALLLPRRKNVIRWHYGYRKHSNSR